MLSRVVTQSLIRHKSNPSRINSIAGLLSMPGSNRGSLYHGLEPCPHLWRLCLILWGQGSAVETRPRDMPSFSLVGVRTSSSYRYIVTVQYPVKHSASETFHLDDTPGRLKKLLAVCPPDSFSHFEVQQRKIWTTNP